MHSSSVYKSNQPSSSDEVTSRRPRGSYEDAPLYSDAKINLLLPEKHLRVDHNALDSMNEIPNPVHSYIRDHPYYCSGSKSNVSTTQVSHRFALPTTQLHPVCARTQPLETMFANMPKFDLLPNLADSMDRTYSYGDLMQLSGNSIGSLHTSVINNDINMAYSAPADNFISRTNGTVPTYASVAAAPPPSHLSFSNGISGMHPNVAGGSKTYSNVSFHSKKVAKDKKKVFLWVHELSRRY